MPALPEERRAHVREKFQALVTPVLGVEGASMLLGAVQGLQVGNDLSDLFRALKAKRAIE